MNDFPEVDYVDMVELFEDGDFTDGSGRNALLLTFEPDLFQGKNFVSLLVWVMVEVPLAM